jgi:hypothetical protein
MGEGGNITSRTLVNLFGLVPGCEQLGDLLEVVLSRYRSGDGPGGLMTRLARAR